MLLYDIVCYNMLYITILSNNIQRIPATAPRFPKQLYRLPAAYI